VEGTHRRIKGLTFGVLDGRMTERAAWTRERGGHSGNADGHKGAVLGCSPIVGLASNESRMGQPIPDAGMPTPVVTVLLITSP